MAEAVERGDIKAVVKGLSPRQRRFCEEYVIDYNGSAAAIRSGYAVKWADRQAHQNLQHDGIAAYVNELQQEKAAEIAKDVVDKEYVLSKILKALGFAEDAKNTTGMLRAAELLARHLGMLTDKQEITGKDGGPLAMEQRKVEENAQTFTALLNQLRDRAQKDELSEVPRPEVKQLPGPDEARG
jgi:phage terminase small subunit